MDPLDAADVHYRLASALFRSGQLKKAKRQVIMALEVAPRYRDAHALLIRIVGAENNSEKASEHNTSLREESKPIDETNKVAK